MTISNENLNAIYSGNDSTVAFPTVFVFENNSEVKVTLRSAAGVDTLQIESTNYTLTGGGQPPATGTVTMNVAPATGETLIIERDMPYTQSVDYVEGDAFPAESHENALDRIVMTLQQLAYSIKRALKAPTGVEYTLPDPEAGKAIGWNSTNDDLVNLAVDSGESIGAAQYEEIFTTSAAQAAGTIGYQLTIVPTNDNNVSVFVQGVRQNRSAYSYDTSTGIITFNSEYPEEGDTVAVVTGEILGTVDIPNANAIPYIPSGTGAVTTNVQDKLREFVSVTDFGAVGNDFDDASDAIQLALNYAAESGGRITVYLEPKKIYKLTKSLDMRNMDRVYLDGNHSTLKQYTDNTPTILFGVNATGLQRGGIENLSITYITPQPLANSEAIGIKLWKTASSIFRNITIFNAASGIYQAQEGITSAIGDCLFELIYIYAFSNYGVYIKPFNTSGTQNYWSKIYINGAGGDVLEGMHLENQEECISSLNLEFMNITGIAALSIGGSGQGIDISNVHFELITLEATHRGLMYFGTNSINIGVCSIHNMDWDIAKSATVYLITFFNGTINIGALKLTDIDKTGGTTVKLLRAYNSTTNPAYRVVIDTIQDLNTEIDSYGDAAAVHTTRTRIDAPTKQVVTYSSFVNPNFWEGWIYDITLTGNITIDNPLINTRIYDQVATMMIRQDATGGRTVSWGTSYVISTSIDTTPNAVTVVRLIWDGDNWREV